MFPFTFCSFSPQLRLKAASGMQLLPPECGLTEVNLLVSTSDCRVSNLTFTCAHTLLRRGNGRVAAHDCQACCPIPADTSSLTECAPLFCRPFDGEGTLMLDNQGHSSVLAVAGITQLTLSFWPRIFRHRPKCSRVAQRFCQGAEGVKPDCWYYSVNLELLAKNFSAQTQVQQDSPTFLSGNRKYWSSLMAPKTERITFASLTPNVSQSCRHCEVAPLPRLASTLTEMKTHHRNNWLSTARSFFFACACMQLPPTSCWQRCIGFPEPARTLLYLCPLLVILSHQDLADAGICQNHSSACRHQRELHRRCDCGSTATAPQ
ncbi:hypothetical protein Pelo_1684 [Pelomyxa schiedti]|nr:hypothetical protein Pelo_1684 [Pelomyxa schiedti]